MEFLVALCIFSSAAIVSNDAAPFAFSLRDFFIPGISERRVFIQDSPTSAQTTASPLVVFGGDRLFESPVVPVSFGNQNEAPLSVHADNKGKRLVHHGRGSDAPSSPTLGNVHSSIHFPGGGAGGPTTPATAIDVVEGSGDSVFFPSQIKVNFKSDLNASETAASCGPMHGTTEINGTCIKFLSRNACPANEWFVLDDETQDGRCVPVPCPIGQLMYQGKCVDASDESTCNAGQMLYVDFNGTSHCDCLPNFIYDPWVGECYAQGDQGQCSFGEYIVVDEVGLVQCQKNPCLVEGLVYHNATGRCYQKMYSGFCEDGYLLAFPSNMTAECQEILIRSIFDLPTLRSCASGSVRSYAGSCRQEFRVPSASSYPVIYGGCVRSFVKDSRGTCRRTHKLFG